LIVAVAWGGAVRAEIEHTNLAATPSIVPFLAVYIAEDAHLWQQQELDVTVVNVNGLATMNAVIAGSADFALSTGGSITRAAAHGQKLLAIAELNNQNGQIVVLRKELAEAADFDPAAPLAVRAKVLQGRTMAITGIGSVADSFLKVIANAGGVDPNSITIATMGGPDLLAAFSRRSIDGMAVSLPYPQQVVFDGTAVIIADGTKGEPEDLSPVASALLVTRPQFCAEHRSICAKMGHSLVLATAFLMERQDESMAILKHRFPNISDGVLASSYEAVRRMTRQPPNVTLSALQNGDLMNSKAGFLMPEDKVKSYDELFTTEFVK
jgi:ABC-type nitrate/sulfonate/bicarbonate transport system substrate-binding protein